MRDAALLETARRRSGGRKTRSSRRAFFVNGASLVRGNGAVAQDWGFVLVFTTGRGAACPAFTADRAAFAAEGERAHSVEGWGMALGGGRCPRGGAGRRRIGGDGETESADGLRGDGPRGLCFAVIWEEE